MAGIYIHIPFCRQKCYYCDFYKTVNTMQTGEFVTAVNKELNLNKDYLNGESIDTIYFGGGTPSVLDESELDKILQSLHAAFSINPKAEITFEANPDDLTVPYLKMLARTGINRLSIGIQSFQDEHLKKMNRRHNTVQARESVINATQTGFSNISVDLIYGLPGLTQEEWESGLDEVFKLPIQHLSAYHLTYHKGTPFYTWLKKGTLKELSEDDSILQFSILMDKADAAGFDQYEISNFAKDGLLSQHNSSYWNGISYLGLGPSAHSYDGKSRQWNVASLASYLKAIQSGTEFWQKEVLSENELYNDYIITRLRTKWGVSVQHIQKQFGNEKKVSFLKNIQKYVAAGKIIQEEEHFRFSPSGYFVSDNVMADLLII